MPITDLGNYALVLGRPLQPTDDILSSLWLVLIIFGVAGVIIAAVVGAYVARSSLRPVHELSAAVEHVTVTKELTPITINATSDIAVLAESFNQMLESLASSRDRQARLIADAGHELRTPLTSLRTNIELLAADAKSGMLKQQDRIDILADVKAQLVEFTELIGDLVQLARDETASTPEALDFRNVVNSAVDRVRRRAHGLGFDVELNPFYVVGDSDMLERAVTNLLDNAVKWSPPGGTIRVQLEGDRLRVADQGPGISESDMPFIFDRFYRGDFARQTSGTGLGLRSWRKRWPSTAAGSKPVAQHRAEPNSPFSYQAPPTSRHLPSRWLNLLTSPTRPTRPRHLQSYPQRRRRGRPPAPPC